MEFLNEKLAKELIKRREDKLLTIRMVAELSGVKKDVILRAEMGNGIPKTLDYFRVCHWLKVNPINFIKK